MKVQVDRDGSTRSARTELRQQHRIVALAQVLSVPETPGATPLRPSATDKAVGLPADGTPFEALAGFVPFAQHLEIRSLGKELPLAGGSGPWLRAWVRLRAEVALPPLVQLAVLADAMPRRASPCLVPRCCSRRSSSPSTLPGR